MTKTEAAVVRAAMKESRHDVAREWGGYPVLMANKMKHLAAFCGPAKAARLRACAAHAQEARKDGKRNDANRG